VIVGLIVISKLLKRRSKVKRRALAYSRALDAGYETYPDVIDLILSVMERKTVEIIYPQLQLQASAGLVEDQTSLHLLNQG